MVKLVLPCPSINIILFTPHDNIIIDHYFTHFIPILRTSLGRNTLDRTEAYLIVSIENLFVLANTVTGLTNGARSTNV